MTLEQRNRHSRDSHVGETPASVVELSATIDQLLVSGMTLPEAIGIIHDRLTLLESGIHRRVRGFSGDAEISPLDLVDDRGDSYVLVADTMGDVVRVSADVSSFTEDATDPTELTNWSSDGNSEYTAWVALQVDTEITLRIHTDDSGMIDTLLAIFGPSASPPGSGDAPYHLSDDAFGGSSDHGIKSSLHDSGGHVNGTNFSTGSAYSLDSEDGITLTPGTYWLVIWPYDGSFWDSGEGDAVITFERLP